MAFTSAQFLNNWMRYCTKEIKLKSPINRLSRMGSFVKMLQEMWNYWHREYEKSLFPLYLGSPGTLFKATK